MRNNQSVADTTGEDLIPQIKARTSARGGPLYGTLVAVPETERRTRKPHNGLQMSYVLVAGGRRLERRGTLSQRRAQ